MWVRLTFVKLQPDKLDEHRMICYEQIVPVVKAQPGNIDIFELESVEEAGEIISLTSWESKEAWEAYETTGKYAEMVNKVRHTFAGPPEAKSYEVKR